MPYEVFALSDFRGGINVDATEESIADNELVQADNAVLDIRGAIATRKGTTKVNQNAFKGQVTDLIEWQRDNGDVVLIAVIKNLSGQHMLFRVDYGELTFIALVARGKIGWFSLHDTFYFVDGVEYRKWDGSPSDRAVLPVTPSTEEGASDLSQIAKCRWITWNPLNNMIYAAGNPDEGNALYFSSKNDPTYFGVTSKLFPTRNDGPVTGLALFADALCVFYSDSVWAWRGVDELTATWRKIPAPYGTINPDTICLTPNSLTWLAKGAIVSINPALLEYNLVMLPGGELLTDLSSNRVGNIVRKITRPNSACAVYDSDSGHYLLAYSEGMASQQNEYVLALDWTLQAYTRFKGWQVNSWCKRKNGDLLFGTNNYIIKTGSNTYTDIRTSDGSEVAIGYKVVTKRMYLGSPFATKRLYKMLVAGEQGEAISSSVNVVVKSIGYESASFTNIVFAGKGMKWGDPWGTPWASTDLRAVEIKPKLKGDRFQVELSNNKPAEGVVIHSLVIQYRSGRRLKGVKYGEAD